MKYKKNKINIRMLVHRKKEKNKIDKDAYRSNSKPPSNVPLPVA
jgi:hypothetical protein